MDPVDLALVLAIDVSASVDFAEFGLMVGGFAAAFRDAGIAQALAAGPRGAVAVAAVFWSGGGSISGPPEVAVDWQRLDGAAAAAGFADALDAAPRLPGPGATSLGQGMAAGLALLARCPAPATRLVLDVSGDGSNNYGPAPAPARDIAVAAGITINALVVEDSEPNLVAYFAAEVIGGPGSFVMACPDYAAFAEAIRAKLARELGGALLASGGVAHNRDG